MARITDPDILRQRAEKMLPKNIPATAILDVECDPTDGENGGPSYWIYLDDGYWSPEMGCQTIHEDTLRALRPVLQGVEIDPDTITPAAEEAPAEEQEKPQEAPAASDPDLHYYDAAVRVAPGIYSCNLAVAECLEDVRSYYEKKYPGQKLSIAENTDGEQAHEDARRRGKPVVMCPHVETAPAPAADPQPAAVRYWTRYRDIVNGQGSNHAADALRWHRAGHAVEIYRPGRPAAQVRGEYIPGEPTPAPAELPQERGPRSNVVPGVRYVVSYVETKTGRIQAVPADTLEQLDTIADTMHRRPDLFHVVAAEQLKNGHRRPVILETPQERRDRENRDYCRRVVEELEQYTGDNVRRCPCCGEILTDFDDTGTAYRCPHCGETADLDDYEPLSLYDYLCSEVLDSEYIVDSSRELRDVRHYVTLGGPTVWIDTEDAAVNLTWGGERSTYGITWDAVEEIRAAAAEFWEA